MEFDKSSESFKALIKDMSELVKRYGLHASDGPVSLQPLIDDLNINVIYKKLPPGGHGFAINDPIKNVPSAIVINSDDTKEKQSYVLAHELVHLIRQAGQRLHHSWDGLPYSLQEEEADLGAAYLKVPFGYLAEMTREGHKPETIAAELGVRKELVELRWRMAVEFDICRAPAQ